MLTKATVISDGLGMNAKPLRLGSPALAVVLMITSVTLKPCKPLRPVLVSLQVLGTGHVRTQTFVSAGRIEVDVDDWKLSFV